MVFSRQENRVFKLWGNWHNYFLHAASLKDTITVDEKK